jgi:hypothetical protein
MKTFIISLVTVLASLSLAAVDNKSATSNTGTPGSTVATPNSNIDSNRIPSSSTTGSLPPTTLGDRATTYPESTSTGQTNPPTPREVERQRNEMNRQRQQMKNRADCSTISDVNAKANCESHRSM